MNSSSSTEPNNPFFSLYNSLDENLKNKKEMEPLKKISFHYAYKQPPSPNTALTRNDQLSLAAQLKLLLLDLFQRPGEDHQHLGDVLKKVNLLDENHQTNLKEVNAIRKEFPFAFYYHQLRNQLNNVVTAKFDLYAHIYAYLNIAYSRSNSDSFYNDHKIPNTNVFHAVSHKYFLDEGTYWISSPHLPSRLRNPKTFKPFNLSEAEKFRFFEQELLERYYFIRKNQGMFSSRLGDALEHFLKDTDKLNLVEKYGIRIPHTVEFHDVVPNIMSAKPKPKRIAILPIDVLLNDNLKRLSDKLKREYDEVVLVHDQNSVDKNVSERVNALKSESGLTVRESYQQLPYAEHYQKLVTSIQDEPLNRSVEFSIFDDDAKRLVLFPDLKSSSCYYLVDTRECHRFDAEKQKKLQEDVYHDIIGELKKYYTTRRKEEERSGSQYHGLFFGWLFGSRMTATIKTSATQKLINYLEYKNKPISEQNEQEYSLVPFTSDEITALTRTQDRLGKIVHESDLQSIELINEEIQHEIDSLNVPVSNKK